MWILKMKKGFNACMMMNLNLKLQGFNGTKGEKGNQGIPGTVFGKHTLHSNAIISRMTNYDIFSDPQRLKVLQV